MNSAIDNSLPNERPKRSFRKRLIFRLLFFPLIAVGGLFFLSMTSPKPENLGVYDGRLADCPDTPNCVSTQTSDNSQLMPAIPWPGTGPEFADRIKSLITADFSNAKLITEKPGYLHFEFTSLVFRFVDDVEFLFDDEQAVVQFRSASRVGHSDLGANRRRMKKITEGLIR